MILQYVCYFNTQMRFWGGLLEGMNVCKTKLCEANNKVSVTSLQNTMVSSYKKIKK